MGGGGSRGQVGDRFGSTCREDLAEAIDKGRPWSSIEDVKRPHRISIDVLEALATAGVFGDRRSALWGAGAAATNIGRSARGNHHWDDGTENSPV